MAEVAVVVVENDEDRFETRLVVRIVDGFVFDVAIWRAVYERDLKGEDMERDRKGMLLIEGMRDERS